MLPDFLFLLAKGGRVILSRNRDVSGAHAIGTQCDLRAIASKFGRHNSRRRAPTRGTHKGHPQGAPTRGTHKGRPYRIVFSRRFALGRAPTRGAPTNLSSLGVLPWEGHPQGAPLPIVFSRRFALGRAPTRGAPTDCLLSAFCPGKGTHKGCPYRWSFLGVWP